MGITNNLTVYELYNREIIFDYSIDYSLKKGLEFEQNYNKELLIHLMEVTRDKHTYLNRITQIFNVFKELTLYLNK
jgi:hypothetical protein